MLGEQGEQGEQGEEEEQEEPQAVFYNGTYVKGQRVDAKALIEARAEIEELKDKAKLDRLR